MCTCVAAIPNHFLLGFSVVMTSKQYMMCVTSVTADWLAELGGVFYSIRERNVDGLAHARATREFSRKAEIEQEMADQREQ
jgi:pre-mRNA-splicing factor ATP-dependent RNA helicase DHX38/PRP16